MKTNQLQISGFLVVLLFLTGCYTQLEVVERPVYMHDRYERAQPQQSVNVDDPNRRAAHADELGYLDDESYDAGYFDGFDDAELYFRDYGRTQPVDLSNYHLGYRDGYADAYYDTRWRTHHFRHRYYASFWYYDPFFWNPVYYHHGFYGGFYAGPVWYAGWGFYHPYTCHYSWYAWPGPYYYGYYHPRHRSTWIVYNNYYVGNNVTTVNRSARTSGAVRGTTTSGTARATTRGTANTTRTERSSSVDRSGSASTVNRGTNRGTTGSTGTVNRGSTQGGSQGNVSRGTSRGSGGSGNVQRGSGRSGSSGSSGGVQRSRSGGSSSGSSNRTGRSRGGNDLMSYNAGDQSTQNGTVVRSGTQNTRATTTVGQNHSQNRNDANVRSQTTSRVVVNPSPYSREVTANRQTPGREIVTSPPVRNGSRTITMNRTSQSGTQGGAALRNSVPSQHTFRNNTSTPATHTFQNSPSRTSAYSSQANSGVSASRTQAPGLTQSRSQSAGSATQTARVQPSTGSSDTSARPATRARGNQP